MTLESLIITTSLTAILSGALLYLDHKTANTKKHENPWICIELDVRLLPQDGQEVEIKTHNQEVFEAFYILSAKTFHISKKHTIAADDVAYWRPLL